jgi:hypothetical protein
MKMALKRKNDEFLVMPHKHVLSVMDLVNDSGTPKLWAIAHENDPKMENNEFLVTPLKNVLSVMGLINHLRIPKLWTIAHKKAINAKMMSFLSFLSKMYRLSYSL